MHLNFRKLRSICSPLGWNFHPTCSGTAPEIPEASHDIRPSASGFLLHDGKQDIHMVTDPYSPAYCPTVDSVGFHFCSGMVNPGSSSRKLPVAVVVRCNQHQKQQDGTRNRGQRKAAVISSFHRSTSRLSEDDRSCLCTLRGSAFAALLCPRLMISSIWISFHSGTYQGCAG